MTSTTDVNSSGLTYLTQIFGSGQQSSLLSSPGLQSALQNASAGDVAELSDQALQLQNASVLFGDTGASGLNENLFGIPASTNASAPSNDVLAALSSDSSGATGTPSLSTSLAAYSSQQQENLAGSLLNVSA